MKTWTVDQMLEEHPCGWDGEDDGGNYCRERLERLWAGRAELSVLDMLGLGIPAEDRVWGACLPGALTPEALATWAEIILARAITTHALHCGIDEVEQWARRWLSGADRSIEAAARAAQAAWAGQAAEAAARAAEAAGAAGAAGAAAQAAEALAWAATAQTARAAGAAARAALAAAAVSAAAAARAAEAPAARAAETAARAAAAASAAWAVEYERQIEDLRGLLRA